MYLNSLTFTICILLLSPSEKRWKSSYTSFPMHTLHIILYLPFRASQKGFYWHTLNILYRLPRWFSTFLSSSWRWEYVKRAVRKSERDLLAGLNQEQEAFRDSLYHEEDASCVSNYVSKQNYHTSPNTSRSSKETAETVHKGSQKGTEETAVLCCVCSMTSTVCVPVWLPFCSA